MSKRLLAPVGGPCLWNLLEVKTVSEPPTSLYHSTPPNCWGFVCPFGSAVGRWMITFYFQSGIQRRLLAVSWFSCRGACQMGLGPPGGGGGGGRIIPFTGGATPPTGFSDVGLARRPHTLPHCGATFSSTLTTQLLATEPRMEGSAGCRTQEERRAMP